MKEMAKIKKAADTYRCGQISRKYRRIRSENFVGDIADEKMVVGGKISDISLGGFRLRDVPASFSAENHTYVAILSGEGKHYRLLAKPCWKKRMALKGQLEMGFKILDAPWEWIEYIMTTIPENDQSSLPEYQA